MRSLRYLESTVPSAKESRNTTEFPPRSRQRTPLLVIDINMDSQREERTYGLQGTDKTMRFALVHVVSKGSELVSGRNKT